MNQFYKRIFSAYLIICDIFNLKVIYFQSEENEIIFQDDPSLAKTTLEIRNLTKPLETTNQTNLNSNNNKALLSDGLSNSKMKFF